MRSLGHHLLSGVSLFFLAAVYGASAWSLPEGRDEPGPAFFPLLLAAILAVLSLAIAIQGLRRAPQVHEEPPPHRVRKPLLAIGLTALYIASFEPLGFLASTWLYCLGVATLLQRGFRFALLGVPTLATAAIYVLFEVALGLRFPRGPFE